MRPPHLDPKNGLSGSVKRFWANVSSALRVQVDTTRAAGYKERQERDVSCCRGSFHIYIYTCEPERPFINGCLGKQPCLQETSILAETTVFPREALIVYVERPVELRLASSTAPLELTHHST